VTTLLRAAATEVLRLRTVRYPWILLATAIALVSAGVTGLVSSADDLDGRFTTAVGHVGLVSLCSLVLGILAVAGEYRHRTIADTYLSFPRRPVPLVAKLVVSVVAATALGVVAAAVGLAVAASWWHAKGVAIPWGAPVWETLAGGVAANALFAALGVALGAIVRNLVVAVATGLGWILLVETILGQLLGSEAARWLPFAANQALGRLDVIGDPLPQGTAAAVLAAYAIVLSAVAGFVTLTRDVT